MQRERFTNADHEVLTLQADGRVRIIRRRRFSSDVPRVVWLSDRDLIFAELLRWDVPLETILSLPGFEEYAGADPDAQR